jgi:hypothetical protein
MNALLLEQRVAWAWLDKMVGRTPPVGDVVRSPKDRAALMERAYEQLKDGLIASIRAELSAVTHAEEAIAAKYGLDPTFFDWFLINGKHWPPMGPKHRRALRAIQSSLLWFGVVPSQWNNMVIPEASQGDDRDAALIEFADWFLKNAFARIQRRFVGAVWKKSRELINVLGAPASGEAHSSAELLSTFTSMLVADTFQLKPAVQQIVDLMQ